MKQLLTTETSVCYMLHLVVPPLPSKVAFLGFLVQCEPWTDIFLPSSEEPAQLHASWFDQIHVPGVRDCGWRAL